MSGPFYVSNPEDLPGGSIGVVNAKIDFKTAITSPIISSPGEGKALHILSGVLVVAGGTNIIELDGATPITGAMALAANGGYLIPRAKLSDNASYSISSSAAVQVSGRVLYKIITL